MKRIINIFLIIIAIIFTINIYIKTTTKNDILSPLMYAKVAKKDCILVLGAGIRNNKPTPMLQDRLDRAIELYISKLSNKIIVSGDHGTKDYDEVNVMKKYLIENGVPSEDIFMDHAGFSTYDSIYRTKKIFKAKNIIIVTQEYHLYRALYIAKKLNINALGASATTRIYSGESIREFREIIARDKDFIKCIFKPKPKYLGKEIPITGDGNITNDKNIENIIDDNN